MNNLTIELREINCEKGNCVYCDNLAETKDHIPSRNLLRASKNIRPIIVPSCKKCNGNFSKDEEYFRNLITTIVYEKSLTATHLFDTIIIRAIKRKPALAKKMFHQMSLVDFYSKGGIYLGKKTVIKMSAKDNERVFNVLDKYVRGLFFHHFSRIVPKNWKIEHIWLPPKLENNITNILRTLKWMIIDENVFVYGFNSIPQTNESIWCFVFFKYLLFGSIVYDSVAMKEFMNSKHQK